MACIQAAYSGQLAFSVEMQGLNKSTRIDAGAYIPSNPRARARAKAAMEQVNG